MSWLRIFRIWCTTRAMIRRRMSPRKRNRYAGFFPISSKNPTMDSQMLATALHDRHVVVPASEILSDTESCIGGEAGQLAVSEEMVEPQDLLATGPPRDPNIPGAGSRGMRLPLTLDGGVLESPCGHQGFRPWPEDPLNFPHRAESFLPGRQMMNRSDRDQSGKLRIVKRKRAQIATHERHPGQLTAGDRVEDGRCAKAAEAMALVVEGPRVLIGPTSSGGRQ